MIDKIKYLETASGERYPLVFTFNVMEAVQEEYGSVEEWAKLVQRQNEPDIKVLKFFLIESVNEGILIESAKTGKKREPITSREAGWILTEVGLAEVTEKIMDVISESVMVDGNSKNEKTTKSPAKK